MSKYKTVTIEDTHLIRDTCICLHVQRAARAVARFFDDALREVDLTNQQFSLLNALNRPKPAHIGDVARLLAMDRTTLTANLKPLQRRGLVKIAADKDDGRARLLSLTGKGRSLLAEAVPIWKRMHAQMEHNLGLSDPDRLRADLLALS